MIEVAPGITIDEDDIVERFVRASGPGGQNVNKLSTAVELRFDLARAAGLPEAVKRRLVRLAGRRLNGEGVLVILAEEHRTQEANRRVALERLLDLVRRATVVPKHRHATRPTLASKRRRLEAKNRRSAVKAMRRDKPSSGE